MSALPTVFADRRARILAELPLGSAMLVPAARVFPRNGDVDHPYRPDSDFFYLTGFHEPDAFLVLRHADAGPKVVLFCLERDREREIWDGYRVGTAGAVERYGVDAAFPIGELDTRLPDLLENLEQVHARLGRDRSFDDRVLRAVEAVRARHRKGVEAPGTFVDPSPRLHGMRFVKDTHELDVMRRAAAISCEGHLAAMARAQPGVHEYELEAELLRAFRRHGSERPAYECIVGSGPNATILHYRAGNRVLQAGELVLVDAGCELEGYASDVTRTFPVGGRFSAAQRAVYEVVLAAEEAAIAATRPGTTLDAIHAVAVRVLVKGMIDLGLLEGDLDARIADESYRAYYMHRTSHWLGMDVHDVGGYFVARAPRVLVPDCVLTIEPGLYVAEDAACPPEFRGIGIRIEDDVRVTEDGVEVLTAAIPKSVEAVEAAVRAGAA